MPTQKLIGLFGGTFDPVHNGHLHTAEEVKTSLQLDEMRLMPCAMPVHKEAPVASVQQRVALLKLAITGFASLQIDESEIKRGGVSYTVDTLKALRQQEPNTVICLLMGLDAFTYFKGWKEWQTILMLANLIVMCRPGFSLQADSDADALLQKHGLKNASELRSRNAGGIMLVETKPYAISSSEIRARLKEKKSVEGLMPGNVMQGIKDFSLYV